jgi:hypothetical protein
MEEDYRRRRGPGIKWQLVMNRGLGHSVLSGYDIDNLDTKLIEQAESPFEKLFIIVRRTLEENESRCADAETDRLALCQAISDQLWVVFRNELKGANLGEATT